MTLESLLLTALFALTAVAFIGVLNARGAWRTSVAAVLALLCLSAALWQFTASRAARLAGQAGVTTAPGFGRALDAAPVTMEDGGAWEDDVSPGGSGDGFAAASSGPEGLAALATLLAETRALRDGMAAEDPSRARALNDSEYQAFETRAGEHLSRARMLRERAARMAVAPSASSSSGVEEAAEFLNASLQLLNAAARDLQGFFRATAREEEQRLAAAFRQGVTGADGPLRQAESRASALGAAAPDSPGGGF